MLSRLYASRGPAMLRVTLLILVVAGCSPPSKGAWNRPTPGKAAPDVGAFPLADTAVHTRRVPLATPPVTLLHSVAIDSPTGVKLLIGRLGFPTASSYKLAGMASVGVQLFTVGYDPETGYSAEVRESLKGRFPAERLARDIKHIYLSPCPKDGAQLVPSRPGDAAAADGPYYGVTCTLADGTQITERIDGRTLATTHRRVHEAGGRELTIAYSEYAWWGETWHPRKIELRSKNARVSIALSGVEPAQ